VQTVFRDGNAFVPVSDLRSKLRDALTEAIETHIEVTEPGWSEEDIERVAEVLEPVTRQVNNMLDSKNFDALFTEEEYPKKVGVIVKAVSSYKHSTVGFGEWLTAEEIEKAVAAYSPHEYESSEYHEINGPMSISNTLSYNEDDELIEIDRDGRVNRFRLKNGYRNSVDLDIEEPRDIVELPCIQNIDEMLKNEGKPERKLLYPIARILLSLDNDFTKEELADFFRVYDWFDYDTTMYQLGYEERQKIDGHGHKPLPISCNNETNLFMNYCIGRENCNYSIYGSLDFKDDVMDRLEQVTSEA
jgi:hypothetical protein